MSSKWVAILAASGTATVLVAVTSYYTRKLIRSHWQEVEEHEFGNDTIPSVIGHFRDIRLDKTSTVEESNRRRTASYYLKARQAHSQSLVLGNGNFKQLLRKRYEEIRHILSYSREGTKSHRTVIIMCDPMTQQVLETARERILEPLNYSHDPKCRKGIWIPRWNLIPPSDMHVTVAIPWWWHTMRDGNRKLSQDLANRFRQALVLDFHHPFQLELERIILLGGKTLVALWRTIGERTVEDESRKTKHIIQDRHGSGIDPMVRLRREIVNCFTTEMDEVGMKPLTYHSHKKSLLSGDPASDIKTKDGIVEAVPAIPRPSPIKERRTTIEAKTPGMGEGDGFIHTTLCRLPLKCLSMNDVELEPIHRLCREATATYAGHRMVVDTFRFLETTGHGGDSNPCVAPIFDETMEAPAKVVVDGTTGNVNVMAANGSHVAYSLNQSGAAANSSNDVRVLTEQNRHATIGALPDLKALDASSDTPHVQELFDTARTRSE